ncbi:MAG: hypothetical protein MUO30_02605 [Anaerolineales bacterium]|jgi:hypothetical protein|nr:hypothetical protein [Anaerolineales bacterium]
MNIQQIVSAIRRKRIRITDHADEEAQADHLSFDEIFIYRPDPERWINWRERKKK